MPEAKKAKSKSPLTNEVEATLAVYPDLWSAGAVKRLPEISGLVLIARWLGQTSSLLMKCPVRTRMQGVLGVDG